MDKTNQLSFGQLVERHFQTGVARAIAEHKRAGRSIAIWKDGRVVIVPPDEIKEPKQRKLRTVSKTT
ncbi:MAG: hypothetical protein FJY65_04455 [Calditrichaeota bacterium]|nr:hypothetical protein [Calditrichota bacterium]